MYSWPENMKYILFLSKIIFFGKKFRLLTKLFCKMMWPKLFSVSPLQPASVSLKVRIVQIASIILNTVVLGKVIDFNW